MGHESTPDDWAGWPGLEEVVARFYGLGADAEFYRTLVDSCPGVSVELGIGAGRVASVARPAVGVDFAPGALRAARARLNYPITLIQADFRDYRLDRPASLTYCPLNSLNLFDRDALPAVLANVRRNTVAGGTFAFDTYHQAEPVTAALLRAKEPVRVRQVNGDLAIQETMEPLDGGGVRITTTLECLDGAGAVQTRQTGLSYPFFFHSARTLTTLVRRAGWLVESRRQGFPSGAGRHESPRELWLLRRVAA